MRLDEPDGDDDLNFSVPVIIRMELHSPRAASLILRRRESASPLSLLVSPAKRRGILRGARFTLRLETARSAVGSQRIILLLITIVSLYTLKRDFSFRKIGNWHARGFLEFFLGLFSIYNETRRKTGTILLSTPQVKGRLKQALHRSRYL